MCLVWWRRRTGTILIRLVRVFVRLRCVRAVLLLTFLMILMRLWGRVWL